MGGKCTIVIWLITGLGSLISERIRLAGGMIINIYFYKRCWYAAVDFGNPKSFDLQTGIRSLSKT